MIKVIYTGTDPELNGKTAIALSRPADGFIEGELLSVQFDDTGNLKYDHGWRDMPARDFKIAPRDATLADLDQAIDGMDYFFQNAGQNEHEPTEFAKLHADASATALRAFIDEVWGDRPRDSEGNPCRFRKLYECSECDYEWTDEWSSDCDDRCPECNTPTGSSQCEDIFEEVTLS